MPKLQADESRVTLSTPVADGANWGARCGICTREFVQEGLHLHRLSNSSFPARSLDHATEGASRCLLLRPTRLSSAFH
jgi:hypothetical protein